MKNRPPGTRWQELFQAVAAKGAIGVIALALIVILACVVTGASASVIYAMVALIAAMTVLVVAVSFALQHNRKR